MNRSAWHRQGVETFDCEADAGYVYIGRPARSCRTASSGSVTRDYDKVGRLLGYELLRSPRDAQ